MKRWKIKMQISESQVSALFLCMYMSFFSQKPNAIMSYIKNRKNRSEKGEIDMDF